ncbi:F0F1 ATP synthase subunit gamma [Maridesulfovibrio hydrothermalis]|uniref:H+transporting two-sector ATPase gamma subunit n=1 Tax=Maridesulfovibrio hydrothermalis AM13 = DSM 14728 TaxID=1121451 RepID=L0RDE0_9BACT|nr:F0F1 ATP synthase subunit gamma [Maridesulfovibrio hydrothermalis]CCO24764.1 H+transporting two-sector ATPase gamma subunit [Maridesulfovibrio hydrothermalis AM13 = DSM 14728]
MQQLEAVRKKIATTGDLLSVVKTMKALAAVNIRHFENAAKGVGEYAEVVDEGWTVFFKNSGILPRTGKDGVAVVLAVGSDQGMCGQFNEISKIHTVKVIDELLAEGHNVSCWTCGERVRGALEDSGVTVDLEFRVPGSLRGVDAVVDEIERNLEDWKSCRNMHMFSIVNNLYASDGKKVSTDRILPLRKRSRQEMWWGRSLPMTNVPVQDLFSTLFREYLYISVYGAIVQSLAAENSARLAAMQVAEKNIIEHVELLESDFRNTRQSSITGELLDIVAGVEAVVGG